jgi:hypothetical protein
MTFSERYGYKKVRDKIQIDSMDEPLRNALWNHATVWIWESGRLHTLMTDGDNVTIRKLCVSIWSDHFKKPLEEIEGRWRDVLQKIRDTFFKSSWNEVNDFIEFAGNHFQDQRFRDGFFGACNKVMERELSAYRFVGNVVTRVTDKQEIEEIDQALQTAQGPVQTHLQRALQLLSDRKAPDHRNSIKESISAVESLVSKTVGEKGTLGQLIKKLEGDEKLHPALQAAFGNLYGYTSDGGGIRHALMEAENVSFEEAKFMLVVCSAFVNFVQSKAK